MKRFLCHNTILIVSFPTFARKGRTIRKLIGQRGGSTKKKSRKGKLNEENSCTPINPKNIHAMA